MTQLPWLEGMSVVGLAARLESHYRFECEAGPLKNCVEWIELRKRITEMAALIPEPERSR